MPLARSTVNGITGIIKKAANYVKACCCKKYQCDSSTGTCTPDPNGPYESESECKAACEKHYSCNTTTYVCYEDPSGPYTDIVECERYCAEEKHYCCGSPGSPEDRDCYTRPCSEVGLDEFGVYDTPEECDEKCKAPHYACDISSYTCYETETGPYADLAECERNCKEDKYYCCGSFGSPDDRDCYTQPCDELGLASYGTYDTQIDCDTQCKGPRYACDVSSYTCYQTDTGTYASVKECEENCKEEQFYCCEDSAGSRFCSTDCEFEGANPVGGPYSTEIECNSNCTKYRCVDTSTCEQHPDGTYTSESECVDAAPYDCELLWKCVDESTCEQKTYEEGGVYRDETDCVNNAPEDCKPKRYDCVMDADGNKFCEETDGGPYETSDCDKACETKKKYKCIDNPDNTKSCVEDPDGPYDKDDCGGECDKPKKYSCVDNPDNTRTCIEDINGAYTTANCDDQCKPKKYKCAPLADGTAECAEDPNGEYDTPDCNGQCEGAFVGFCCTDYGVSNVSRQQCADWGGDFFADQAEATAACPCDCVIGGDYCVDNGAACGFPRPDPPDGKCGPGTNTGWSAEYHTFSRAEQGGSSAIFCDNGDCSPLADYYAKNARLTAWFDYAAETAIEASEECCLGYASTQRAEYRVYALNCRKGEWEEVANVMKGQWVLQQGSTAGQGLLCNGGWPPGDPALPEAQVRKTIPICIPPAPNPLP